MASEKQLLALTDTVLEAVRYRRWRGGNENPALGKAILIVDQYLLPWAGRELADGLDDQSADAENLVAEAGYKAIVNFHTFVGTTGGEFYEWVRSILAQLIAGVKRLREALRNGGLRRVNSVERNAEAARLVQLLVSPEHSPEEIGTLHENASRLWRAIRRLNLVEQRVARLYMDGRSLRDIAVMFGHTTSWARDHWDAAAHDLRTDLLRPSRTARMRSISQRERVQQVA